MLAVFADERTWVRKSYAYTRFSLGNVIGRRFCLAGAYGWIRYSQPEFCVGAILREEEHPYLALLARIIREQYPERVPRPGEVMGDMIGTVISFNDH